MKQTAKIMPFFFATLIPLFLHNPLSASWKIINFHHIAQNATTKRVPYPRPYLCSSGSSSQSKTVVVINVCHPHSHSHYNLHLFTTLRGASLVHFPIQRPRRVLDGGRRKTWEGSSPTKITTTIFTGNTACVLSSYRYVCSAVDRCG